MAATVSSGVSVPPAISCSRPVSAALKSTKKPSKSGRYVRPGTTIEAAVSYAKARSTSV